MNREDLTVLVRGIAPAVHKFIGDALKLRDARIATLEANMAALAPLVARVAALEAQRKTVTSRGLAYQGVWTEGTTYEPDDTVTWNGALWVARSTTTARPGVSADESRAWTLACKAGRDGKPGKDGRDGRDAPSVGPPHWEQERRR